MSFTGDLEHLPIVDVIQLLHSTRKSGTLCVRGRKGESQLVFKDGYIVSANHPNNSIRIGRLLAESGAITAEALEQALALQQKASGPRKPLIALLIESGALAQEAAYRGLTALIEVTIVEMLRNVRGTFALDVERFDVSDEFRYFPEHLQQELSLNTQMVLMDALRLFDERNRDGLEEQPFFDDELVGSDQLSEGEDLPEMSADDLGLGDLDHLVKNIPEVFAPIEESDPAARHREQLAEFLTDYPDTNLASFVDFLTTLSAPPAVEDSSQDPQHRILICYSSDQLLRHGITTLGQHTGLPIFTTSEELDLAPIVAQFLARGEQPLLLLDAPETASETAAEAAGALLQRLRQEHGELPVLQLSHPGDYQLALQALRQGANMILPRPPLRADNPQLGPQLVATLGLLRVALANPCLGQATSPLRSWHNFHSTLRFCTEPAEISFALLQAVAEHFPRALTLVVGKGELIVERGIGLGPSVPAPRLRLPLTDSSLLRQTVEQGDCLFGPTPEPLLPEPLLSAIGAPRNDTSLLLPLQMRGRTAALIYADFGREEAAAVSLELLQALALHAGLALDNAIYRKQLEKTT